MDKIHKILLKNLIIFYNYYIIDIYIYRIMNFKNLFINIKDNIDLLILLLLLALIYISYSKNIIKNENFANNQQAQNNTTSGDNNNQTTQNNNTTSTNNDQTSENDTSSQNNNTTIAPRKSCEDLLTIRAVQKRVHTSLLSTPCRWDRKLKNSDKIIQNFNIFVNIKLPIDSISEPLVFRYALTIMKYDKLNFNKYKAKWKNNKLEWVYDNDDKPVTNDDVIPNKDDLINQDTCCNLVKKKFGMNDTNNFEECTTYIPVLQRIETEKGLVNGKPAFEIPNNSVTLFTTTQKIEMSESGECEYLDYANNEFPVNIRFNKHNPEQLNMFLKMDKCKGNCNESSWGNNVAGQKEVEEGKKKKYKHKEPACVKPSRISQIGAHMKMCIELIKKDNQRLYRIQYKDDISKEKYYLLPDINKLGQIGTIIGCEPNAVDCKAPNTQFGDRLDIIPLIFVKNPYENNKLKNEYNTSDYQIKQVGNVNNTNNSATQQPGIVHDNFMDLLYEFKPQECKRKTRKETTARGTRRSRNNQ